MPIKPENKKLYPKNWKEIVASVRERSGNKCEWEGCGCKNGAEGIRLLDGSFYEFKVPFGEIDRWPEEVMTGKIIKIVLTTAHLDHDPTNNDLSNLRHWCQYHHLRYDAKHHAETARATREARSIRVQPVLFAEATCAP